MEAHPRVEYLYVVWLLFRHCLSTGVGGRVVMAKIVSSLLGKEANTQKEYTDFSSESC